MRRSGLKAGCLFISAVAAMLLGVTTIGFDFRLPGRGLPLGRGQAGQASRNAADSEYLSVQEKLAQLERILNTLWAALEVDSVRQYNIRKVMRIIDRYNPDMPSSMKYRIANEIYNMSLKYSNLNVDLICATITHESAKTWDPKVTSEAGAMGLMQIMPTTGMFLAQYEGLTWTTPEEVLYDPIYNIRLGTRYLSTLIEFYGIEGGLAAYNGGTERARLWLAHNKNDEYLREQTRQYIPAVLKLYEAFRD